MMILVRHCSNFITGDEDIDYNSRVEDVHWESSQQKQSGKGLQHLPHYTGYEPNATTTNDWLSALSTRSALRVLSSCPPFAPHSYRSRPH